MQQQLYEHYFNDTSGKKKVSLKNQNNKKSQIKRLTVKQDASFSSIHQELSEAFDSEAKDTRKSRLQLTANVAGLRPVIDKAYEVEKIVP